MTGISRCLPHEYRTNTVMNFSASALSGAKGTQDPRNPRSLPRQFKTAGTYGSLGPGRTSFINCLSFCPLSFVLSVDLLLQTALLRRLQIISFQLCCGIYLLSYLITTTPSLRIDTNILEAGVARANRATMVADALVYHPSVAHYLRFVATTRE